MHPLLQIILLIIGLTILLGLFYGVALLRLFKQMHIQIDQAESALDVSLTKRLDMLNQLLDQTKTKLKPDNAFKELLATIRQPGHSATIPEKETFGAQVLSMIVALFDIIIEHEAFNKEQRKKLAEMLIESEEILQRDKKKYNLLVSNYNQKVVAFPSCYIAKHKKYLKRAFFTADAFTLRTKK